MLVEAIKAVVSPPARWVWRPTIEGAANVPRTGPVIIASNHLSFVDSVIIPICAPRPVAFLAKAEYFEGRGVKGTAYRLWYNAIGSVPVDRGSPRGAQESLDAALAVLRAGGSFGIYPEGTRSRDGRLYRGRTGVAWLALTSGAPVVPVALAGTQNIQPIGERLPRVRPVTVTFGTPRRYEHDGSPSGRRRRVVTDDIMDAIHALSGQELAGAYNDLPAED
ncbi:MAG TPA: lysophospholipid acyltransferase family protein [Candidatus Nanopelagicales bacterium]|jgi:1-acyl-sn-glycerol-3-phosphate acyltransferase|nr:lysophospholipid acyltransferase family protein [Candidatus Nanopelagicales bacterium]